MDNPIESYVQAVDCNVPTNYSKNKYTCILFGNYGDNILTLFYLLIFSISMYFSTTNSPNKPTTYERIFSRLSRQSSIVSTSLKNSPQGGSPKQANNIGLRMKNSSNRAKSRLRISESKTILGSTDSLGVYSPDNFLIPQQSDLELAKQPLEARDQTGYVRYIEDNLGIKFFMIQLMACIIESSCFSLASVFSIPLTFRMSLSNWLAIMFLLYYAFTLIALTSIINNLKKVIWGKELLRSRDLQNSDKIVKDYIKEDSYISNLKYFDFYFDHMKTPDRPWKLYLPVIDICRDLLTAVALFIFGNHWVLQNTSVLVLETLSLLFEVRADTCIGEWHIVRLRTIKGLFILYIILKSFVT